MHGSNHAHILELLGTRFARHQPMGDDANHLSPCGLGSSRNRAHQANAAPAINQAKPARGELSAKGGGGGGIFRAGAGGGARKNTNAAHGITPLPW